MQKSSLLGEQIWELSAIEAKEINGVTQSVYVEGKEADIRQDTESMKESEKLPFKRKENLQNSSQYLVQCLPCAQKALKK